jgi:hypothetical protein
MSANLSSCKCLRLQDPSPAAQDPSPQVIAVSSFAPQGCTIRGMSLEAQVAGGAGSTTAIMGGPTGATLTLLDGATTILAVSAGGYVLPLTATAANLQLASTDILTYERGGNTQQNAVNIYFGDYSPTSVTVS